jgi:menaquinone-dependent protoporphyrinogen oxidase
MEEGEKANKQFNEAFPEELRKYASAIGIFGGEFNFERMNVIEKFIVKKIAKVNESVSKISEESINQFVEQIS